MLVVTGRFHAEGKKKGEEENRNDPLMRSTWRRRKDPLSSWDPRGARPAPPPLTARPHPRACPALAASAIDPPSQYKIPPRKDPSIRKPQPPNPPQQQTSVRQRHTQGPFRIVIRGGVSRRPDELPDGRIGPPPPRRRWRQPPLRHHRVPGGQDRPRRRRGRVGADDVHFRGHPGQGPGGQVGGGGGGGGQGRRGEEGGGDQQLLGDRAVEEAGARGRHRVEVVLLQAMGDVHRGHVDRSDQAPRAQHDARQDRLLHRQVAPVPHRHLLPEEVRLPRNDAGDCCRSAGDGGRYAPPPALPPALRAERRLDPRAAGGGRERAHAPHDLHGGGAAEVVRARPRHRRPGRLLQRLLLRLPHLPQVRAPRRRVPRGGGRPLLHRVPQGPRRRQDRQRPRPGHRHRLLAPPCQRHPQGRGHGGARRRGSPPRRQPLRIGRLLPGYAAEGHPGADRIPLRLGVCC